MCHSLLATLPGARWQVGRDQMHGDAQRLVGVAGANALLTLLSRPDRRVPVVAVSEYEGAPLTPDLVVNLARRLFGLAVVVRLDENASWSVTDQQHARWSCFHAAVRLYWPGLRWDGDPFGHPLWTADRLLSQSGGDARSAADGLTRWLFDHLRRVSTFSVRCPAVFDDIRQAAHTDRLTELRKQVRTKGDATRKVADTISENQRLREELEQARGQADELLAVAITADQRREELESRYRQLENEFDRFRTDVENERLMRSQAPTAGVSDGPTREVPPTTVAEAVTRATERFAESLVFGADVRWEYEQLAEDAGEPDRLYRFLAKLAELSELMRKAVRDTGSPNIGVRPCVWLTNNGCAASEEFANTVKSKEAKRGRTWDAGFGDDTDWQFENHMKVSDGTAHNRCVRVYFDWCSKRQLIVVGSVGRKPTT